MTRLALLTLAVLLTACANAPAGYTPAPTFGPIANGIMAEAGATSAAATGVAFIATGQAVNAIAAQATAEYRATVDSLSIAQAQATMQSEVDRATSAAAYAATITQESVNATATARAVQSTQINQAIIATGTALAYDAQVADARAQAEIMQARSDTRQNQSLNDLAYTGVLITSGIIVLGVLALVAAAVYFGTLRMNDRREIDREAYQEKKDAETDEARAKAAEQWARVLRESIIERGGKEYLLTRRGIVPMLPAPEPVDGDPDYKIESEWRALAEAYIQSATELGRTGQEEHPFSEPSCVRHDLILHPDTRRLWREGHRRLIGWLKKAKILTTTETGGKTDWAGGWTLDRFEREFSHTALPAVPSGTVPVAKIIGRSWEVGEVREIEVSL